jgi:hypothetical protein
VIIDASVVSAGDLWAAAADASTIRPKPVLARWNGTSWTEDNSIGAVLPTPTRTRGVSIAAIRAFSDRDVWVQAWLSTSQSLSALVVHWNGSRWRRVGPSSPGYYLPTAVPDGHGGWWSAPFAASRLTSYLLHEVNGRWTRFRLPTPQPLLAALVSIAHVPHSRAMLATGQYRLLGRTSPIAVVLAFGALPS